MEHTEVEILLIEDNPQEAELAIRSLRKSNLANKLLHIDDGAEALDFIFSKGNYAGNKDGLQLKLILLDLKLPRVDGLEILRQIKSDEQTKLVPVVVLTSSSEETARTNASNMIFSFFIYESFGEKSFECSITCTGKNQLFGRELIR